MVPGMLVPILLSIGMALAAGGSMLGPLFYIFVFNAIVIVGSYTLFMKGGYKMGDGLSRGTGKPQIHQDPGSTLVAGGGVCHGGRGCELCQPWYGAGVCDQ